MTSVMRKLLIIQYYNEVYMTNINRTQTLERCPLINTKSSVYEIIFNTLDYKKKAQKK